MAEDPLIYQRFVQGTHRHGDMLNEAQRHLENAEHARNLRRRSFNWKSAILLLILIAAVVGALSLLYLMAEAGNYLP